MLSNTAAVVPSKHKAPQQRLASMRVPQTVIIRNPNSVANQNLQDISTADSVTIESMTTPGEISNSSRATAYFDSTHPRNDEQRPDAVDPRIVTRYFEFSVIDTG